MEFIGRSIMAYFVRREQAEKAQSILRREGYTTVQLDRNHRFGGQGTETMHNPLTGDFGGLADLTVGEEGTGAEDAALLATDVSASGLAHAKEPGGDLQERAWMLTVVTTEDRTNRAVQILEDTGGLV